jgi:hypothetical protein
MLPKPGAKFLDFRLAKLTQMASPSAVSLTEAPSAKDPEQRMKHSVVAVSDWQEVF